jgi:hypothetical protein
MHWTLPVSKQNFFVHEAHYFNMVFTKGAAHVNKNYTDVQQADRPG